MVTEESSSQCLIFVDYSNSEGWWQVGEDVEIKEGKLKFIDGAWDSSQRRVYRKLDEPLKNHCTWTIEAEFTPIEFGLLGGLPWVGHSLIMLTETDKEPFTDCPDVACSTKPPLKTALPGYSIYYTKPTGWKCLFYGFGPRRGE